MNTFIKRLLAVADPTQMKVCLNISNCLLFFSPVLKGDFIPPHSCSLSNSTFSNYYMLCSLLLFGLILNLMLELYYF